MIVEFIYFWNIYFHRKNSKQKRFPRFFQALRFLLYVSFHHIGKYEKVKDSQWEITTAKFKYTVRMVGLNFGAEKSFRPCGRGDPPPSRVLKNLLPPINMVNCFKVLCSNCYIKLYESFSNIRPPGDFQTCVSNLGRKLVVCPGLEVSALPTKTREH